jgi:hypothetical protein
VRKQESFTDNNETKGLTDRQHQQDSSAASSNSNSYAATLLHEKKVRSKLRESRHMAQCVLMDRELLMVHALASHEVNSSLFVLIITQSC